MTQQPDKAIVFTQFAELAKILEVQLAKWNPVVVMGEVPAQERQRRFETFKTDPSCRVIIGTEAMAYGVNLQEASYVVHVDQPWSVAKLMQREDRAHRMGQTKPVTVYNLIARGTIDEYVAKVLKKKNRESVEILEDDVRLEEAGLSAEDVKEILRI